VPPAGVLADSPWDGMATSRKVRPGAGPPGLDQTPWPRSGPRTRPAAPHAPTTADCCTKAPALSSPAAAAVRADRLRVRSCRESSRAAGLRLPRRPLPRRSPMPPRGARTSLAAGRRPAYPGMRRDPCESHRLRSRRPPKRLGARGEGGPPLPAPAGLCPAALAGGGGGGREGAGAGRREVRFRPSARGSA
jgi:hypothetical protein